MKNTNYYAIKINKRDIEVLDILDFPCDYPDADVVIEQKDFDMIKGDLIRYNKKLKKVLEQS